MNSSKSLPERALIVGDGAKAPRIVKHLVGEIALVVTSPPYYNAISYKSHASNAKANYRQRQQSSYASEYLPLLDRVWNSCLEMLRPGGYLAVNVGTVLADGYQYPVPQDILWTLTRSGWEFIRSIQWYKVTAGVKRAGSVIRWGYPGYWYPNIMTEHIVVVRKPGSRWVLNNETTPEDWWFPAWNLAPVPPGMVNHPAPFPEELPHRLTLMLTRPGDWVMDPFLGSGTTAKAALHVGRRALGFDVLPEYVQEALRRTQEASGVRKLQLRIKTVDEAHYTPTGKTKGPTRHGAGLKARRR